ncbi:thioesterase-like superfamily-domain-containing protein, partial [Amylostereum chailletii]
MAPFHEAAKVEYAGEREGAQVYVGSADKDWTVGSVPHGGYVLALVLGACVKQQSSTAHIDPLHLTAHYMRSTTPGPFKVRVKTLRTGKSLTNLTAELIQDNTIKVTTHAIFGVLEAPASSPTSLTLAPPAPFARVTPFTTHP